VNIIEIYKDTVETMWKNSETFLCVFDDKNNLLADYDFCTGLKLMQDEQDMIIFIKDEDLIAGRWVFFATKVNKDNISEKIQVDGKKDGVQEEVVFSDKYPWSDNCGPGNYVSRKERQERVSVCISCPLFDSKNMTCTVDNVLILESTKSADSFCPEEKWGDKEAVMARAIEEAIKDGDIIMPSGVNGYPEDQSVFEEDLDKYLEGM